ncbi:hypothetical protein H310_03701 [Aphanomyces invadans]|uniref:Myb/SANT-like domain-containing protein n=1 Tax=Aphanomyces invadans TaxID=157072 RepID=A0A024UKG0_9STRA|nr:hypothetical protein H310_03701 [Aphanomyces invadans]ETW06108.1 hypothetical protein H310_03701 [Aphanomyces invadans]|eukprot:XP_008865885.1 hypothetical protein H310_03701 [Aphanomyces invadans]
MASKDSTRASWTLDRDEFIVTALQAQVDKCKRSDSGYKKEAWVEVTVAFNERFGTSYHSLKVKSRLDCLKREYKDVLYLLDNSGFGWNEDLGLPTAPDDVWAAVLKASPSCKKFRFTPFPLYENLAILLDGAYMDGQFSSMPPGSIEQRDNSGNETASSHSAVVQATGGIGRRTRVDMSKDYENSDISTNDACPPPKNLKQ